MADLESSSPLRSQHEISEERSPEEYFYTKEIQFPRKYQQYRQITKDIKLQKQPSNDFDKYNHFEEENDMSDWVIISDKDSPRLYTQKEGFLDCYFQPIVNKRKMKYLTHWVTLEDHFLNCYQSKESANQLKYRKLPLDGAVILNGQSYTGKKLSFRISCVGENIPFYFLCRNTKEYNSWFNIINATIQTHKECQKIHHEPYTPWMNTLLESLSAQEKKNESLEPSALEITCPTEHDNKSSITKTEIEWIDSSLEKHLSKHPECASTIISDHVEMILTLPGHPLSLCYQNAVQHWKEEHYFMVYTVTDEEILHKSVVVIKEIIQEIVTEFFRHYPNLHAFSKSIIYCTTSVERILFDELYEQIFSMYKLCYKQDDIMHTTKIHDFSSITPAHFGISERLWLLNDATLQIPYQEAVELFKSIRDCKTPHGKANCLLDTGNMICTCVSNYYAKYHPEEEVAIGGDELLPLFAYVVIRSQIPNPFSEFRFVEDFLNEALCKGEVSYFLVTYCTSLALISYLRDETLSTWHENDETKSTLKQEEEVSPSFQENNPKILQKRPRVSSLIEVQLDDQTEASQDSDFLTWATSLIRK